MKKYIILSLVAFTLTGMISNAQTAGDALNLMEDNPIYNARVNAMGGAFTALGGDVSSININPAGGAVNHFSTWTITPGVTISSVTADGTNGFSDVCKQRTTKANLGTCGFNAYFDTYQSSGFKGFSIGFNVNRNRIYNNRTLATGIQENTSFAGYLAACATGIPTADFRQTSDNLYNGGSIYWPTALGWKGALIDPLVDSDTNTDYLGVTENLDGSNIVLGGKLGQIYERYTSGNKTDLAFTFATNISDKLYLGASLGLIQIDYNYEDYLTEYALNSDEFATSFNNLKFGYLYNAQVSGVYGKFGFIAVPVNFLRLGGAIETPTLMDIEDTWRWESSVNRKEGTQNVTFNENTPTASYKYRLTSPMKYNIGAAITLGQCAIFSLDYAGVNYGNAVYSEENSINPLNFKDSNNQIAHYLGKCNTLRMGIEFKPTLKVALRAGYVRQSCPEYYYDESSKKQIKIDNPSRDFCAGIGYDSLNSFFADFSITKHVNRDIYYTPYQQYITGVESPEIKMQNSLVNCALTLGFRF